MTRIRYVFERGVEICLAEDGKWYFQSSLTKQSVSDPAEITKKYGIRPTLFTIRDEMFDDPTYVLPIDGEKSLEGKLFEFFQIASPKETLPSGSSTL